MGSKWRLRPPIMADGDTIVAWASFDKEGEIVRAYAGTHAMSLLPNTRIRVEKTVRHSTRMGKSEATTEVTAVAEIEQEMLPTSIDDMRRKLWEEVQREARDAFPVICSTGADMMTRVTNLPEEGKET